MVATSAEAEGRIRVAVSGAAGRMGTVTCKAVTGDAGLHLVAAIDPAYASGGWKGPEGEETEPARFTDLASALDGVDIQVVVEFSIPAAVRENVVACVRRKVPVVVGTTGLGVADLSEIERETELNGVPVLVAPNFAMGAVLMMQFARKAAEQLEACEIIELHHQDKLDAPSGTSRLTRLRVEEAWRERGLDKEVPIHSVRLPGLVAHQEVIFGGPGETLTIRHDSLSRDSFMPGVLLALKRVRTLQGLVVGLENIL
jgi:4-hydroxy-tetrahydrodipicolinate reductase